MSRPTYCSNSALDKDGYEMMAIIDDSLVLARPITNGYSFTLASRIYEILQKIESDFGARDKSYTLLGVEFSEGIPQTWFPGNSQYVIIQLGHEAMQRPILALYQLAHECVHLLDPHPGGTNVLEEGAATHFAHNYIVQLGYPISTGDKRYDDAHHLVEKLLSKRPDALKELRKVHGPLRNIKADHIRSISPGLADQIIENLTKEF